jgi:hypothetical protein
MADERDICERLEDPNYDGAVFLRLDAAKEITALRYYVARLEGDLASEEYQHARTKIALENAQEHSRDQAFDIVMLGQEVGRLRATLKGLVESCEYLRDGAFHNKRRYTNNVSQSAWSSFCLQVRTARAAIAEKEEK